MSKTHVSRLLPGNDLRKEIEFFVKDKGVLAGWIACGVGSLRDYNIRFANQREGTNGQGYLKIVTLTGTVSVNGCHIHISISDETGKTIGGHLLEGNLVYTTAEIVIQEADDLIFRREIDKATGWKELLIERRRE